MSATPPHDQLEQLIAADALHGLSEPDRRRMEQEMAEHGPSCPECIRLVTEYAEVAGRLAIMAGSVPLSPGAPDRLLRLARDADAAPEEGAAATSGAPAGAEVPRTRAPIGSPRRWLAAVAVAASLVVAGSIGYTLAPRPAAALHVATLASGRQSLSVVYQPGSRGALIIGSNLAAPPQGTVYELWFRPNAKSGVKPAGTFAPRNGAVRARVSVGSSFDLLAVSVEPPGGSPQPTTTPIFVKQVSSSS